MAAFGLHGGGLRGRCVAAAGLRVAVLGEPPRVTAGAGSLMRVRPVVMAACSVCDVLRRPGRCRRRALGGCFAAWRWTRVAVDRTGADPDGACVVIVQRNVRHRAEDPGALDVEDGVPPPRAAPPLLRRVVLNRLPSTDLVSSPGARARAACLHAACF